MITVKDSGKMVIAIKSGNEYEPDNKMLPEYNFYDYKIGDIGLYERVDGFNWITFENGIKKRGFSVENFELYKEGKQMKKSDLKTGMLVQRADGEWRMVVLNGLGIDGVDSGNYMIGCNSGGVSSLGYINDDLTSQISTNGHIVKVATIGNCSKLLFEGANRWSVLSGFQVIWERKSDKQIQLEELITKLQTQLTEAQGQLKSLT